MSLNVTQNNQNLTLHVSQSNIKATLSVTQNINELHVTAIQNNEITKLQPIVNTISPDYIETDPIFQASEASLFVVGDKANLDNQSGVNTGDETTLSIQTKRPLKTINGESLEGNGNVQIDYNDLDNVPTLISNHSELVLDDGTNPHGTTKSDVGLSNVDNTSDLDKPISTATQSALNNKADLVGGKVPASQLPSYVDDVIEGYFNGTDFYTDALFTNLITPESSKIYIDILVTPATQYRWNGSAYVQIGGGVENYFVDWEGYIQFTQNPTGWYGRSFGPQNSYWTSQFSTLIGTNPQLFDARQICKVLPFDCKLINANVRINRRNNVRTIRIKGYKFNSNPSTPTPINVVEIFDLTKTVTDELVNLVQGVDFTINSAPLTKGDCFLFVVNQETDASALAANITMNFEFEKI